jgi:hypothetical protein
MIKNIRSLFPATALIILTHIARQEMLIEEYKYPENGSGIHSYYSDESNLYLTLGFWFLIEFDSPIECPIIMIDHFGDAPLEIFTVEALVPGSISLSVDQSYLFGLRSSFGIEEIDHRPFIRDPKMNWEYLIFSYSVTSEETKRVYTRSGIEDQASTVPHTYSLYWFDFHIGDAFSDDYSFPGKFRIVNFEVFLDSYNMREGIGVPRWLRGAGGPSFIALYKLNVSPFSRSFVNLIMFPFGQYFATIVSPQKSHTEVNFPRTGDQLNRYTFGISKIEIFYDPELIMQTIYDKSYSFCINYKAFGTNTLARRCRQASDCLVPDFKFLLYGRSHLASPRKFFLAASRTWSFKDLSQEARYTIDDSNKQIYSDKIIPPSS